MNFALRAATIIAAVLAMCGAAQALDAPPQQPRQAAQQKVLRYAFLIAETGFDPAQVSDLYSRTVIAHIFDALYQYDYLARPSKIRPNTAADMPQVSEDFKTWTIRIKPGIYFSDDPAFKGVKRELVAQDYVYTTKRFYDPALNSPSYGLFTEAGLIGLDELREQAQKTKKPFDYDRDVDGVRALDRYTLQFKLKQPRPRFLLNLADNGIYGALAREVVDAYPGRTMEHPVGTGPFRLSEWRRSSRIVLERNPNYRDERYDAQPDSADAEGQALLQRFKGRRLPMIDRVEISIIEESQPRWLAFLNSELDQITVPLEFTNEAAPKGKLAPNLAKRGVQLYRTLQPDRTLTYFNMEDPVVGGYTPEKVALRRAIALATDVPREIRLLRRGQALVAQSMIAPYTFGYDPHFRSEGGDFDVARAKALLDLYGYVDRDGDGWRELPDGSPLVLDYATTPDSLSRAMDELWKHNLDAVGLRVHMSVAKWPEQLKRARAGQLMMWQLGYTSTGPDVQDSFQLLYGPAAGGQNLPRFKLPAFDKQYELMQSLPDGPERLKAINEANREVLAYAPIKFGVHRIANDLTQPWLVGYRRPPFGSRWWMFVDIDEAKRAAKR